MIYSRTSSSDGSKFSIDQLVEVLKKRIDSEGNVELYKVYKDYGYSGVEEERPDFNKLIRDIKFKKLIWYIVIN